MQLDYTRSRRSRTDDNRHASAKYTAKLRQALWCLFALTLAGCGQENSSEKVTILSGTAMTMPFQVTIGQKLSREEEERIATIVQGCFSEVDALYNKYNPTSEISLLNRAQAKIPIKLSPSIFNFLEQTTQWVILSHGLFDPTIEPVMHLWRKHLENDSLPSEDDVSTLRSAVGWTLLDLSEKDTCVKSQKETELDLGGIAKGYCVDLLTERLINEGFENVLVEWGGELKAFGLHPDGRPWQVAIPDPTNPSRTLAVIPLINQAIATSGDYFQYWTVGGVTYTHICNPENGSPLIAQPGSICSATVVADSCMEADVFATIALLHSDAEKGRAFIEALQRKNERISAWLVTRKE